MLILRKPVSTVIPLMEKIKTIKISNRFGVAAAKAGSVTRCSDTNEELHDLKKGRLNIYLIEKVLIRKC
jgi:hypothetical protein